MSFETAVPFENQEELTELERFYMADLTDQGYEVRYDEEKIYHKREVVLAIHRVVVNRAGD